MFCLNDLTAMGAINALRREFGLRCPEDVLVVGYDNVDAAAWPSYELTTIDVGLDAAAAQVFTLIEAEAEGPHEVLVRPRFVERGSTSRREGHGRP
ncbi:substrate-binding domain-containing protein [Methylorubrum extorquens]|uniref:substrate-binding domain-containing protein n=1 Tax=Methylorubrum extorquens TaxID=408 RepID=UPI001EE5B633|nr:substrate-binding domain-containing protein [Methylorubrum extorquens]MCG5249502.1 substrate-binding domain-containing protein [Methylorubrum extorquens]